MYPLGSVSLVKPHQDTRASLQSVSVRTWPLMRPGPEADRAVSPSLSSALPKAGPPHRPLTAWSAPPMPSAPAPHGSPEVKPRSPTGSWATGRTRPGELFSDGIAVMQTALGSCSVLLTGLAASPPKSGQQRAGSTNPTHLGHPTPGFQDGAALSRAAAPSPAGWSMAKRQSAGRMGFHRGQRGTRFTGRGQAQGQGARNEAGIRVGLFLGFRLYPPFLSFILVFVL